MDLPPLRAWLKSNAALARLAQVECRSLNMPTRLWRRDGYLLGGGALLARRQMVFGESRQGGDEVRYVGLVALPGVLNEFAELVEGQQQNTDHLRRGHHFP